MKTEIDLKELDNWYTSHFEELVEKYPGKAVAVVKGRIVAVGESEQEVDGQARKQYPGATPFVVTVPTEEELVCLFLNWVKKSSLPHWVSRIALGLGSTSLGELASSISSRSALTRRTGL